MYRNLVNTLKDAWSANSFTAEEVTFYAQKLTLEEVRRGLVLLSFILLCLFSVETTLFSLFDMSQNQIYTGTLLTLLSMHIMISARAATETRSLYLLGAALLMISGTAFVLLAHNMGSFNLILFASVTLLFMVVPIVPWGLREALLVLGLIYATFTASTWSSSTHFDTHTLMSLQFVMFSAGFISLALVVRNTCVRKSDVKIRYDLEQANKKMMHLSNKDPLTGAWNRRFLKNIFQKKITEWVTDGKAYQFAFLDLDNFKPINDNYGHDYGDEVLRCVCHAFREALGDNGFLIRMGGDEFALLFSSTDPEELLTRGVETVQKNLRPPRRNKDLRLGMSIGMVSVPPAVSATEEEVYKVADTALYDAKDRKEALSGQVNIVSRPLSPDTIRQITVA